jgi:hypothetical protein
MKASNNADRNRCNEEYQVAVRRKREAGNVEKGASHFERWHVSGVLSQPILLMNSFGPTPETTLSDYPRFFFP